MAPPTAPPLNMPLYPLANSWIAACPPHHVTPVNGHGIAETPWGGDWRRAIERDIQRERERDPMATEGPLAPRCPAAVYAR